MNNSKPLIGMNADFRSARKDSPAVSYLCAGYYDALSKCGAIPVVIPPMLEEADIERVLELLDGVVLIGGADLDPRNDGFMLHPSVRLLDGRRERFDRTLMRLVAEKRMPVFGIGCGMQLLNLSQGGNLFLHLPEDMPRACPMPTPPIRRIVTHWWWSRERSWSGCTARARSASTACTTWRSTRWRRASP